MYSSQITEKAVHHEKQLKTDHYEDANDANRIIADLNICFYKYC